MDFVIPKNGGWSIRLCPVSETWVARALPAPANNPPPTVSPVTPVAPATAQPVAAQASPRTPVTPIKWFAALSRKLLPVLFIDTQSGQLIKINAMSRKLVAQYLRTPIYTDHTTRWTSLGNELRREDFTVATAFQAQEDTLLAMEALESARWRATVNLAKLDIEIHQIITKKVMPLFDLVGNATPAICMARTAALIELTQLLAYREIQSDELARIDEEGIKTMQRLGMPPPEEMVNAFTAARSQAPAYVATSESAA